jgi:hypothetical protein
MKKKKPVTKYRRVATILWTVAILIAAIGVFWLPWHLGSSTPVVGESYAFGFNNRAGILALGVSIFLGAAACYFSGKPAVAYKWIQASPRLFPPWKEARAEYALLIGISALMAAFILFWSSYLVDPAWCEARGFIYGMDLLALGQVPYTDFMYNYGPATIYLPLWLSNLSGGFFSIEQSYAMVMVFFTIGGFVALFAFLRSLEIPTSLRPLVLGVALLVWTCLTMGLQYGPLRFLIVPISLVFLDSVAARQSGRGIAALVWIGVAAAIAAAVSLAISPEMGISTTVAVAAYGFILMLRRWFAGAAACLLGAGIVFAATLLGYHGYLDSVFAFGSGGGNFPIYPNLHNICLVVISLITLSPLIASALANPTEKRAPLALALAVGGGMLLPVAFGRCDPGHVIANSVIPALMMFPAAAGKVAFRIWISVFALLSVILYQVSYWTVYTGNFTYGIQWHEFYQTHPEQVATWKAKWDALRLSTPGGAALHWSKVLPFPEELEQLTSKGRVLLTNSSEGNLWLARFLLLQKQPPREYFDAYSQGASTPAQIERKVKEDRVYQFLIVPQSAITPLSGTIDLGAYQQGTSSFLSKLFLFPVNSEVKNSPYLPDTEYARRILGYFEPMGRYNSYVILRRKALSASGAP